MALKSNKTKHKHRARELKNLREGAGLDQQVIAKRLGISVRKVSNIENCHLDAMENLKIDQVEDWWACCRSTTQEGSRQRFKQAVLQWFKL